jgi:hypothetical protein
MAWVRRHALIVYLRFGPRELFLSYMKRFTPYPHYLCVLVLRLDWERSWPNPSDGVKPMSIPPGAPRP